MKNFINGFLKKFGFQLSRSNGIAISNKILDNYRYFDEKINRVKNIEGDIVECGVGFGHTLFLLLYKATIEGKGRNVHAFDSFEGFPEPSAEDDSFRKPKKGEWKVITPADINDIFFHYSILYYF